MKLAFRFPNLWICVDIVYWWSLPKVIPCKSISSHPAPTEMFWQTACKRIGPSQSCVSGADEDHCSICKVWYQGWSSFDIFLMRNRIDSLWLQWVQHSHWWWRKHNRHWFPPDDANKSPQCQSVTICSLSDLILSNSRYFERDVNCIRVLFSKKFGLEFEWWPAFEDVVPKDTAWWLARVLLSWLQPLGWNR